MKSMSTSILPSIGPDTIIEDIEGLEMFTLKSVGIDIGSSTSHLVFSRSDLTAAGSVALGTLQSHGNDKVLFRSQIMLTPYLSGTLIDVEKMQQFIENAYREARLKPEDIDTGAVIITGEALKKENAQPIVEYFAQVCRKIHLRGGGAQPRGAPRRLRFAAPSISRRASTRPSSMLTWEAARRSSALIEHGDVTQTAAINIGARLIAFDASDVVTRIEDAGSTLMHELGSTVALGKKITKQTTGGLRRV